MTGRLAAALARLMVRTSNTPLRAVWAAAYWSVVRAAVAVLRRQYSEASIYLKGSFASREEVYGLSDVDLVVVLPARGAERGAAQLTAREKWKKTSRRFPIFGLVVQHCWFYEDDDLQESLSSTCLTHGLASNQNGESEDRAAFLGTHGLHDHMGLQTHPSLYGARSEWRPLIGTDLLESLESDDSQNRRLAAWLNLQYWWRFAFQACADPGRDHIPLLCVKLLAEPMRLWLWAERGDRVATREAALRRGLSELPEEREVLQIGLDLLRSLPHSPRAPLPEVIGGFLRQSERLTAHMIASADAAGYVDVKLIGSEELAATGGVADKMSALEARGWPAELLPLADWRARAVPTVPDETIMLIRASHLDPAVLAATARTDGGEAVPALQYNSMLVMPTLSSERGMLRAVQCQPTDPVSIALADGHNVARFPELAGWSALHCARRAVAEHRAWLAAEDWTYPPHGWVGIQRGCSEPTPRTMGLLFTSARAALFLESIAEGRPELAVTLAGVADQLIAREPSRSDVVFSALHDFLASRTAGSENPCAVGGMLDVVRNLSAYAAPPAFSITAE